MGWRKEERKEGMKEGAPQFSSSLIVWIANGISALGFLFFATFPFYP
jgi:hypothetical protein